LHLEVIILLPLNRIGDVMVSVIPSSVVGHGLEPRWGQTKDYEIGVCFACFFARHAAHKGVRAKTS